MKMVTAAAAGQPLSSLHHYFPHDLHVSLYGSSKTLDETKQFHAFSLKTGIFNHPSISSRLLSLYAAPDINNLIYARSVFDRIHDPSLLLWNMMIKCFVENQQADDAISLFSDLVYEFAPDNFTFPCVIKGCARLNAVEEGNQIHGLAVKLGFGSDKFVQSSLVSFYSKCGRIDCSRKVFDKMSDKDLVTWNSLIDGYARCGEVEVALKLFDEMPERDSFSWTVLVDGLSRCGKVEEARELFTKMPNKNLVSWNAMINGYMKSRDPESARRLFNRMRDRNLITWNSMIAGYELNGRFKEALKMFVRMLEEDLKPNTATLTSVLSAVSGCAILRKGETIHSYLAKNGIKLDGVMGTLLIEMYSKCGSIESALRVFRTIQRKKLGHWTAVIVGLGMHGMADKALNLFNEMRQTGMKPDTITFVGLLNACSHAGLVDEARRYFDLMQNEYGIAPTAEHYGCLVDVMCRVGHLEEAKTIIDNMPMIPNKVILMSLLSGARMYSNIDIGEYAAHRLIKMAPDTVGCYVLLSNMYATARKWDKVSQVREVMKNKGIRKEPGWSQIEHRGELHKFVVGDKAHPQTEEIYSKIREMREKLEEAGHIPDKTQVLLCIEGEEEKGAELETHSERLAIAYGLINTESRRPIRVVKNLRVCGDCHSVTKLLSEIYGREIVVRDNSRFHHFRNGSCSCNDFW